MPTPVHDKYALRSLHEEIDLIDRKLAHMLKYETFATEAARKTATTKLQNKRDLLARNARLLVSEGIEFKDSELPRSFRPDEPAVAAISDVLPEVIVADPVAETPSEHRVRQFPSPFAGTVLDGRSQVEAYKRSRARVPKAE